MAKSKLQIRNITKKSLIYSIGTIVSSISTLILIPIYSKYLSPTDYGNYELAFSLTLLLVMVSYFEIHVTMLRFMYGIRNENVKTKHEAIYTSAFLRTISTLLLIVFVFGLNRVTFYPFYKVAILFGFSYALGFFYLNCARGYDKEYEYTTAFSIFHIINLIVNSFLLIVLKKGAQSLLVSQSISYLAQALYLELKLKIFRNFKFKYINFRLLPKMLKFSIPLAVAAVGIWVLQFYSNTRLVALLGSEANGYYTMSLNFARSIPSFANGVIIAWEEIAFSVRGDATEKNKYFADTISKVLVLLSCIYMVFVPFVNLIIPYYLDSSYHNIIPIVAISTAGRTINFFSLFLASIFGNKVNSKPLMISTTIGAVIDVLIIDILIRKYGILGAAISDGIGFVIVALIRFYWLKFENHYNIKFFKILSYISLAVVVGYLSNIVNFSQNIVLILFTLVIAIPNIAPNFVVKLKQVITKIFGKKE